MTDAAIPHLDDEILSAVLDGEATPDESSHADACDECGARLAALRDASLLVRTPVEPVTDAARDAAVAAALAAAESSNVVPMRRRRTGPPTWLAAAAAVVVAVGAVGLLVSRTGDDDRVDFATGDDTSQTTTAPVAGGSTGGEEEMATFDVAAPAPATGGDLGELAGADLRSVIDGAMALRETSEAQANDDAEAESDADSAAGTSAAATAGVPCEPETRATNAELGPLVFTGTGTYEDAPVIVLAFDVGPDRWVYVLALDGCAIRNQQTYSP